MTVYKEGREDETKADSLVTADMTKGGGKGGSGRAKGMSHGKQQGPPVVFEEAVLQVS